jgi:hypothetical protein
MASRGSATILNTSGIRRYRALQDGRTVRDAGIGADQITDQLNERIKALLAGEAGPSHEGRPLQWVAVVAVCKVFCRSISSEFHIGTL